MNPNNIKLLYIDLFCGAGGTSTGVENARQDGEKCAKVIACVNHDKNAIASHAANHPEAMHFTEDIRALDLTELIEHVTACRLLYPNAKIVLWASLECTNFSKAKGGQPRDADSRTLAEHLFRYIEALDPDYIQIENVVEFMSWGDLDKNGKPVSRDRGRLYLRWVNNVECYGYHFDHRVLDAANFGAYTSRKRFFGIFARPELPIVFPHPTHAKEPKTGGLFDQPLKKWKAVKDVLDFSNEGESIFTRKKPLADKTLGRIYAGLIKFVAGGKDKFLSKHYSGHPESKNISVEEPAHTVTAVDHHSLVSACFIQQRNSGTPEHKVIPVTRPARTITATGGNQELVQPVFIMRYNGQLNQSVNALSIENPAPTLTVKDRLAKIQPQYLVVTESGDVAIEVYETDTESMRKIKEFMALYGIMDIRMRMLLIIELKQIMGFGKDYKLIGTQAEQKKYIGNAVEVTISMAMCLALVKKLDELKKAA